ncbi:MAG: hypothetical protein J5843_04340 [Clostridia bacterium]|nr:hypothetical protein [Clostridia bacterium]
MNNPNYAPNRADPRANGQQESGEVQIDIWATIRSVLSRWWLILMVGIACAAIVFVVYQVVHVDTYTSTGNIYLVPKMSESQSGMNVSDAKLVDTFMNDYLEDMTDISNFKMALANLGNEMYALYDTDSMSEEQKVQLREYIASVTGSITAEQLSKRAKVWNETGTHFLYVSYTADNAKLSYAAAVAILNSSVERLKDFYGVEQVDVRKLPENPPKKDASGLIRYTLIAGLAGVLLVIAILAFLYIRDDKINTADDVEQYLGLTVLAMIPVYTPEDAGNNPDTGGGKSRR